MGFSRRSHSKGVPAMASHLTLEEREIIAHSTGTGNRRRESPSGWAATRARSPANCDVTAAAMAIGRWLPSGRPSDAGVGGRGWPRCIDRMCVSMSLSGCAGDGLPMRSKDAHAAIFRAIDGGRFRTRRFTRGFVPRRPWVNTGSIICDVWGESGETVKTGGGCLPA